MAHDVKSLTLYPSPEMEDKTNTMLAIHTNVPSALTNSCCNFAMCTEAQRGKALAKLSSISLQLKPGCNVQMIQVLHLITHTHSPYTAAKVRVCDAS